MPKGRYINFAALEEMYGTEVVEALRRQMEIEADRIVQDMKSRVPVRTGRLRDSIHWRWKKNKTAIEILADAPNPKNGVNTDGLLNSPRGSASRFSIRPWMHTGKAIAKHSRLL